MNSQLVPKYFSRRSSCKLTREYQPFSSQPRPFFIPLSQHAFVSTIYYGKESHTVSKKFLSTRIPVSPFSHFNRIACSRKIHLYSDDIGRKRKHSSSVSRHQALASVCLPYEIEEEDDRSALKYMITRKQSENIIRQQYTPVTQNELTSLDLELGEGFAKFAVWDDENDTDDDGGIPTLHYESQHHFPPTPDNELDVTSSTLNMATIPDVDETVSSRLHQDEHAENTSQRKQSTFADYLAAFDPQHPPPTDNLEDFQVWLECDCQEEAVAILQKEIDATRKRRDYTALSVVQSQILEWFVPLQEEIKKKQRQYLLKEDDGSDRKALNRYGPFMCSVAPAKLAVILANQAIMYCLLKGTTKGIHVIALAKQIGSSVEEEVIVHRMLHKRFKDSQKKKVTPDADSVPMEDTEGSEDELLSASLPKWDYAASHLKAYFNDISKTQPTAKKRNVTRMAIQRARNVVDREVNWTDEDKTHLGAALLKILIENATITIDGNEERAFKYFKTFTKNKNQASVKLHEALHSMFLQDELKSLSIQTTRFKPMVVPPKPWTTYKEGGYNVIRADLVRYHGCNTQMEAMQHADLQTVFDGLNALGGVTWKINKPVLQAAQQCWKDNIPLGDIPSQTDFEVPLEPTPLGFKYYDLDKNSENYVEKLAELKKYYDALSKVKRIKQKNMDLRSIRCSALLKLDQADKFQHFEKIYFPYNMDFRGRAYPIPPHLSNVGSDLCRGVLMFNEAKPLGARGLYWLKVHLANLAGKNKMTFDSRVNFVDENLDNVRDAVNNPFSGSRWWMALEDPFQGLATCNEIIQAIDSGDPTSYKCSLPVHVDGSCNGLQHYAALGRDSIGGKAVNLCATDEPQDVYVGVMNEVIQRVAADAEQVLDFDTSDLASLDKAKLKRYRHHQAAKLVNGLIDRGVVKRTVMTSVYGVTYIGARTQIQEKLQEKLEAKGLDIDENRDEIFSACGYLARVTLDTIGDMFSGAKGTMNWLTASAQLINQHGSPVAWITPIGLPVVQPYRKAKTARLITLLQSITLTRTNDLLPIHMTRQVSAFPPNFIHSLDSSHMLLTALEMHSRGLTFSAVHDSFWTHPCDIDELNTVLREEFVKLYSQPLLEELKTTWEMRYPGVEFPELPVRGNLDISEVRRSPYFFQ